MYFEDFIIGQEIQVSPVTIEKEKMCAFAFAYDPLPFHMSDTYAESSHFGALIAPGVMSFMTVWAEFVKMNLWKDNMYAGKSTKIEWFAPVYAGDILSGRVSITDTQPKNDNIGLVTFVIEIYNQERKCVIKNTTEAYIKTKAFQG